jgi:hypothetical protein
MSPNPHDRRSPRLEGRCESKLPGTMPAVASGPLQNTVLDEIALGDPRGPSPLAAWRRVNWNDSSRMARREE